MNSTRFNQIIEDTLTKLNDILIKKSEEYASDTDRLHNFKVAARRLNRTQSQALQGMMMKHEVSVEDLINKYPNLFQSDINLIEEKINDNLNYLLLLKCVFYEVIDARSEADSEHILDHLRNFPHNPSQH